MGFGHIKPGSPPPLSFILSPFPTSMIDPDSDTDSDTERSSNTEDLTPTLLGRWSDWQSGVFGNG